MRLEKKSFDEGDGVFRVVNKVFSDPVEPNNAIHLKQVKFEFLKILADQQDILKCELEDYDTLRIYYDGSCWVAESQAKVRRKQ
jgi:hypothetical protein